MLRYSLMRLGLFAACFLVVWGLVRVRVLPAGLGDSNLLWVMLLALVTSAPLSFVVLRGVREQASVQVASRVERTKANLAASAAQEDEADDASRSAARNS
ncbi:DUF4229 domain-containing protein [Streptomyces sp. ME01-24h]|nr:DUF4229 domain-containing protein [Streptomyces sp. ME19-03-3]MDX3355312.1 DUF4229 domain-containing protein [Streptomyces sp. ME01-24h]